MRFKSLSFVVLAALLLLFMIGCNLKIEVNCEEISKEECLNYKNYCKLCTEEITSSYMECHTIKYCEEEEKAQLESITK